MTLKKGQKDELITHAALLKRGWTKKMIEDFYPIPDEIKKNPIYASASPMKLYLLKKVERKEKTVKFKSAMESIIKHRETRKLASAKAVKTKIDRTLQIIEKAEITVIKLEAKNVIKRAIESYNNINLERGTLKYATASDDKSFLDRITVNYIRHELTDYDYTIHQLFNQVGRDEAYELLNKKIYNMISENYPQYRDECLNQLSQKIE